MRNKPNLVLLHVDQWRGDCLGVDGHPDVLTPTLDGLATGGVRFQHAYTDCPTCIPARRCLMTGRRPAESGVVGFRSGVRIQQPEETLPAILSRAGYQTIDIGRGMHQYPGHARYGFQYCQPGPFTDRYSQFQTEFFHQSDKGLFAAPTHLNLHGLGPNGWNARPWPHAEKFHESTYVMTKGIEFLETRDKECPFFLSLGVMAPHPPFVPPGHYFNLYMGMDLRMPHVGDWAPKVPNDGRGFPDDAYFNTFDERMNRICKAGYYGLISHYDAQLNGFLTRLAMEKEPTFILFTSDHGEMLGDHNQFRKARVFEGSARIPMILSGPDLPRGKVIGHPALLSDLLPTFAELAGIEVPAHCGGTSLLRLMEAAEAPRSHVHIEHAMCVSEGNHAVTDGRRKFVWLTDTGTELFFDLERDPCECHNLRDDPAVAAEVARWRKVLVQELNGRPEGFVRDGELVPGCFYPPTQPDVPVDWELTKEELEQAAYRGVRPYL